MIQADLVLENGLLKSCWIQGHAGAGPKGADIVCAAVSVLARAAVLALSGREGIRITHESPEPGEFRLEILSATGENKEFLAGVGTFFKEGLLSVSKEYPDFCIVRLEELNNGS
jgi:uncharacterized protein YsxB (DUF464 family)